jgi:ComF family protein
MTNNISNITDKLLSLIFPKKCIGCETNIGLSSDFLCKECRKNFDEEINQNCAGCGKPYFECRCKPEFLKGRTLISTMPYKNENSVCRNLIIFCKRKRNPRVLDELADNMANALKKNGIIGNYAITFAPRSPRSVRKSGFDQAEELAKLVSKKMNMPFLKTAVCKDTDVEQKFLKMAMRRDNALKRFVIPKKNIPAVNSTSFIIIDDVVTSGATLNRCAELLCENGANEVICLGAARTVKDGYS